MTVGTINCLSQDHLSLNTDQWEVMVLTQSPILSLALFKGFLVQSNWTIIPATNNPWIIFYKKIETKEKKEKKKRKNKNKNYFAFQFSILAKTSNQ